MEKYLGEFEQLLLFALLDGDEGPNEADGATIRRRIERRTGRLVSPGAIYTAMDRLSVRGLVSSRVETTPPEMGGRRKKYYWLEPTGARSLERSYQLVRRMSAGLDDRLSALASARRGGRR